ncbi:MAG TPA: response regulator transcription factor [Mycobacteriales bacterium]|nr:response regulator transcription factor [Mycobacteriales bacterium]
MSDAAPASRGLVLVGEDESAIADLERLYLSREGFGVHVETDGAAVLAAARRLRPVALVLDIGLPTMDGLAVCRTLRAADDWTPVLIVTARGDEVDRLVGLELGADDYLTKPFSPRELVARVKAILRRAAPATPHTMTLGAVTLDLDRHLARVAGDEVELTATEFALLAFLLRRPGQVYSRDQLLAQVWGYEASAGSRTVDVHIAQLRAKLGPHSPIRTVRGVGYAAGQ